MRSLSEYTIVIIGILTLLVASASVYGVMTLNTQIQAKSEQPAPANYSAQLDSLNSQIGSLKNQMTSLSYLQSTVADIHEKITDLDNLKDNITKIQQQITTLENNNQIQQIASVAPNLTFVVDKTSYLPGDVIKIIAIGATAQNLVEVELLDNSQFILVHQQTYADSNGKTTYNLQLSSALLPGNYILKLTSGQQTSSQPIEVLSKGTSQSTTSSDILTVQTDKSVYLAGEQIEVSGKAQPNTTVTGVMTSPTGKTYNSVTTAGQDGSYFMFFSPMQPYETGRWSISVSNLAQTSIIYATIQQS